MATLFSRLDRDENGCLNYRDFKILANGISKFGALTEGDEIRKCKNLVEFWAKIMGDKDKIVLEDYITARISLVRPDKNGKSNNNKINNNNNNNGLMDKQIDVDNALFDLIDTNGDEAISFREFTAFFKCIFIHDADYTQQIFTKVDRNGDGQISREEFVSAFRDFMLNEENSSFKELFGPLEPF